MHYVSPLQKHFIESDQSNQLPWLGFGYARTVGPCAIAVEKVALIALLILKGFSKILAASFWGIGAAPINGFCFLIKKEGLQNPFSFKNGFSHLKEAAVTTFHLPAIIFWHFFAPQVILRGQNKTVDCSTSLPSPIDAETPKVTTRQKDLTKEKPQPLQPRPEKQPSAEEQSKEKPLTEEHPKEQPPAEEPPKEKPLTEEQTIKEKQPEEKKSIFHQAADANNFTEHRKKINKRTNKSDLAELTKLRSHIEWCESSGAFDNETIKALLKEAQVTEQFAETIFDNAKDIQTLKSFQGLLEKMEKGLAEKIKQEEPILKKPNPLFFTPPQEGNAARRALGADGVGALYGDDDELEESEESEESKLKKQKRQRSLSQEQFLL